MTKVIPIASAALLAFSAFAQAPSFEVASIRPSDTPQGKGLPSLREDITTSPDTLTMRNVLLNTTIRYAYKLSTFEIGNPADLGDKRFDIIGKASMAASEDQLRLTLQALLAERFKLKFHRQEQDVRGFAITVGKGGSKLTPAEGGGEGSMTGAGLIFEAHKMPVSRLADIVSGALKAPVLDMTGLPGTYDFKLDLRTYLIARQNAAPGVNRDTPGMQEALEDVATAALQEELGLKLEERKIRLNMLMVDSVEKTPTEN